MTELGNANAPTTDRPRGGIRLHGIGKTYLEDQAGQFLDLFWVFIIVMLILGAILAFSVIHVTMTVNLAEHTTELATPRAAGVPVRRLTAALATENLAATVLAIPLGLAGVIAGAWAFSVHPTATCSVSTSRSACCHRYSSSSRAWPPRRCRNYQLCASSNE